MPLLAETEITERAEASSGLSLKRPRDDELDMRIATKTFSLLYDSCPLGVV
jgi:hypothetical protein